MATLTRKLSLALLVLAVGLAARPARSQQSPRTRKTVVLVHGAWADGSCWEKVIPALRANGLHVVAVQNPLTSLADDAAAVKRVLDDQTAPVVLVGHSWGGMVITEAGAHEKVAALVYVAAFAPDVGDSLLDLGKGGPPPPGAASVHADDAGFLWLSGEGMAKDFAQDLPPAETEVMTATQGPIAAKAFGDKATRAAWKTKPSFYIVAEKDRMIPPELERAMAKKLGATTSSLPTSHVPMQSRPKDVVAVILAAVDKVK